VLTCVSLNHRNKVLVVLVQCIFLLFSGEIKHGLALTKVGERRREDREKIWRTMLRILVSFPFSSAQRFCTDMYVHLLQKYDAAVI